MRRPFLIPAAPADPEAPTYAPHWPLVNARVATVELIRINDATVSPAAVRNAVVTLGKYVAGEVRLVEGDPVRVDADADGRITRRQAESAAGGARHRRACDISLVIAPGLSDFHLSYCNRSQADGHPIVVINIKPLSRAVGRRPWYRPLGGFVSKTRFARWLLTHELLHALHLPYDPAHASVDHHCARPECMLYSPMDGRFALAAVLRLGLPRDLCRLCRADLRRARAAAGGRFFESDETYDPITHLDEMVRLNPGSAVERIYRGQARQQRGDVDGAIADFSDALRLGAGPRAAMCFNNRAALLGSRGRWAECVADCERALSADPEHVHALRQLANVRATCPDRSFRDPGRAVELARRAVELTQGQDPHARMLLGVASLEAGRYAEAVAAWESCAGLAASEAAATSYLAHVLACCREDGLRDGVRALALARRACDLTGWTQPWSLDVLAAACAETGDFQEAVAQQEAALTIARADAKAPADFIARAEAALAGYRAQRPRRLDPAAPDAPQCR